MESGIYELVDPKTGVRLYLGQSTNLAVRRGYHLGKLSRNTHPLKAMQDYVNTHGMPEWGLVTECNQAELNKLELHHFQAIEPLFWGQKPFLTARYTGEVGESRLEKICTICDKPFTAQQSRAKYCSDECYYEGRKRKHNCKQCGVEFRTFSTRSDWCSTECRFEFKKQEAPCLTCGSLFASHGAKYCSSKCEPKRSYSQICSNCEREFTSARPIAIFCSAKCRHDRTFACTCRKCGKIFEARHANARLCSAKCGSQVRN